jgi:hypothetical protein
MVSQVVLALNSTELQALKAATSALRQGMTLKEYTSKLKELFGPERYALGVWQLQLWAV